MTTIRARLESLEARCDLLEQALQRTRQEAARGNVEEAASSRNDDSPDTDTSDIATDTSHRQAANPKGRHNRKSARSAISGSPSAEQLPHQPVPKKKEEATSRHGPQYRRHRKIELTRRRKHSSKVAEVGQLAGLTPSATRTPCTFPGHQGDGLTYDRSHSVKMGMACLYWRTASSILPQHSIPRASGFRLLE